jgi:hypothetical protein
LPKITEAGGSPGSPHTPTWGCLLPWPQEPCSPNPGLEIRPTMWLQHTHPSRYTGDAVSSWSQGCSAILGQRGWVPSCGSHRKLSDRPAGPGCRRPPPSLGMKKGEASSLSQRHLGEGCKVRGTLGVIPRLPFFTFSAVKGNRPGSGACNPDLALPGSCGRPPEASP